MRGVPGFTAQAELPREVSTFLRGSSTILAVVKGACSHLELVAEPGIIQKVFS